MNRWVKLCLGLVVVVLFVGPFYVDSPTQAAQPKAALAKVEALEGRLLSDAQSRRKLGVTFSSVMREVKLLAKQPGFDKTDTMGIAAKVLESLTVQAKAADPQLDVKAINWDAVFAFIEKLIPLILKLIELFGGL